MTGFMLDTDISSYIIRRRPAALAEKFQKHADTLCVSVMTAAELRFGAEKAGRPQLIEVVEGFLERLAILDWTGAVTTHYARIRSALEQAGKPIGNMDLLIAAHAVSQRMTLVTNNLRHFAHVPGLKSEVWG
ncbi:type II toxin-antitoxin system VapC family toxin [Peristeroidobacter soli]|jgi:tRNA(fMet)-specific endonuclease VapC|uniref:type II toxin-antitoxin system VapC family toxin n=1 Tax=Peristeroidobacter soli TaxID=2497877 RepID=UPI00101C13EE|nr:type II toxin-antitoxin system VapC family toxin [Peristeroidobacter soli]